MLSGLLDLVVRYGAIPSNPARVVGRSSAPSSRTPRALTVDERQRWVRRLAADPAARRKDLPRSMGISAGLAPSDPDEEIPNRS
ncbi:hypothetical protein GCM10009772_25030 [Pseudonocardia alni subsp. carboxydivorans]